MEIENAVYVCMYEHKTEKSLFAFLHYWQCMTYASIHNTYNTKVSGLVSNPTPSGTQGERLPHNLISLKVMHITGPPSYCIRNGL